MSDPTPAPRESQKQGKRRGTKPALPLSACPATESPTAVLSTSWLWITACAHIHTQGFSKGLGIIRYRERECREATPGSLGRDGQGPLTPPSSRTGTIPNLALAPALGDLAIWCVPGAIQKEEAFHTDFHPALLTKGKLFARAAARPVPKGEAPSGQIGGGGGGGWGGEGSLFSPQISQAGTKALPWCLVPVPSACVPCLPPLPQPDSNGCGALPTVAPLP